MLQFVKETTYVNPIERRATYLLHLRPPVAALPPPPGAVLPALPNELLALIVHALDTLSYDRKSAKWTEAADEEPWIALAACARTSKAFLHPARERLYRKVTIFVESPRVPSWQLILPDHNFADYPEELLYAPGPKALECTLAFSPHLASLGASSPASCWFTRKCTK